MAQGYQVPFPQRLFDNNGVPANAWKIHTYAPGTTTPVTTYSEPTLSSANANPIVTSTSGIFNCYVGVGVSIKTTVTDANDVPQTYYSFDGVMAMPV